MRRLLSVLALLWVCAACLSAQEAGGALEPGIGWKWANFVILAVALGYLMAKLLPPIFKDRTEEIQKGIAEARAIKQDADKRASAVEASTARLGSDIERFRLEARAEMQQEGERIRRETASQIAHLERQAQQDIEISSKLARRELKNYAAKLSLDLAEQRVRERLDGATEQRLVDAFIQDLERESKP